MNGEPEINRAITRVVIPSRQPSKRPYNVAYIILNQRPLGEE